MRILQVILAKALCVVFLLMGAALIWKPAGDWYHRVGDCPYLPQNRLVRTGIRIGAGSVAVLVGVFTLLPLGRCGRRRRQIVFTGPYGNTIIRLDSVEASLNRALMKLPDVKRICVRVMPSEDQRKVHIQADMKVIGEGAREAADRIGERIRDAAKRLLGVDEVTAVDIYVSGMEVDLPAADRFEMPREPAPARRPVAEQTSRAVIEPEAERYEAAEEEPLAPGEMLPEEEPSAEEPHGMKSFDPDALAGYDDEEPDADSEEREDIPK